MDPPGVVDEWGEMLCERRGGEVRAKKSDQMLGCQKLLKGRWFCNVNVNANANANANYASACKIIS